MRLIDADALKKVINKIIDEEIKIDEKWARGLKYSLKIIDNAPTVTPDKIQAIMSDYLVYRCEPQRPQGEWIYNKEMSITCSLWNCSVCNRLNGNDSFNFCPNCGAKMKGGEDNG